MNQKQRWEWLSKATDEASARGVGRALGVHHTTIQRWVRNGMPDGTLIDLIIKYNQDPVMSCVVWGLLKDEDVPALNWDEIVKYIPGDVLTGELHNRTRLYLHGNQTATFHKTSVWDAPGVPARSDMNARKSFRLTSK